MNTSTLADTTTTGGEILLTKATRRGGAQEAGR